jgi:acyl-CoA synthetase (AMP-forming)/AMP-acid ligase II
VEPQPSMSVRDKDVLDKCRQGLPSYMVPAEIMIIDTMPRNANGKLDREQVRLVLAERFAN